MARENKLREYQSSILARLESVKHADAEAPAGYLGVRIGDKNILVDLQEITETLPVAEIHPVPLVKPWFLGVSNVRGVIYAINDLAQIVDNRFTKVSSNTRLLLIGESVAANVAFLADKLIGLRSLSALTKRDLESEDNICLKPETYEDSEKRIWHILDCAKFAQSKEFAVPYAG
jgi:twitching motility protein PilI